jgi:hypothetical protein
VNFFIEAMKVVGLGSTILAMGRASALLLVAVFSFSLISPALVASDANSKLPTCCRRNGAHHCAITTEQSESSSGPALRAGKCPSYPTSQIALKDRTVSLSGTPRLLLASLSSLRFSSLRTQSLGRSSYSRAGQKRGPPSFLA